MEIRDRDGTVQWRILALDGADVPDAHGAEHAALLAIGPGQTVDVEIRVSEQDLRLLVRAFNTFEARIRVRAAPLVATRSHPGRTR